VATGTSGRRRLPRVPAFTTAWKPTAPSSGRHPGPLAQILALALMVVLAAVAATSAYGSTVSSASFSGGAGTVSVGTTLFAKQGGALTLNITTSSDTKCVDVSGAFTGHLQSSTAKTSWTFSFTAPAGDGAQSVNIDAMPNFNGQNKCTGNNGSGTASYVLDNTGPTLLPSDTNKSGVSPGPNAAGWNNSNVSIAWSASDAGSGVASGPTPATDSVSANNAGVIKTATASDRLGNSGNGSVTVKLDKTAPSINGSRSPAANGAGWNNTNVTVSFTCSDALSGIKSCTGGGSVLVSTEGANQSVPGAAVDNADNTNNAGVTGISVDKTAPSLSGAPTTSANSAGWYNGNVTIHWTCSDALSGIAGSCPGNDTISSEGTNQKTSASVSDVAGNATNTTSSPGVNIDKTAPVTNVTAPTGWNNQAVTLNFAPSDALSGVDQTWSSVDGGLPQMGANVLVSGDGQHTVEYWSVDKAGNVETADGLSRKSVLVKIDGTSPTISASQSPAANTNGWNNSNVDVAFACADALSGIASCTPTQTITTEGANQDVVGTAIDNANNTATAHAFVSLDKTPPTISAAADRAANAAGWYDDDVMISFACDDAVSGIDGCAAAQMLSEGENQSASGAATDAAGNTASASVSGINVDKTAPSLGGAATTGPNANGWYNGDVTIAWTCSDALSGIPTGGCPADSTIAGEGSNLSASESLSDKAGNSSSKTISGIKIDRFAPSTSASVPTPLESGWYAGPVQVTLNGVDNLSDVDKTYYSVDGAAAQLYSGPFSHSQPGDHTITFWSVDNAGNVEDKTEPGHSITVKIDNIPPTIAGNRTPANANGWNNAPVTVSFTCSDAESGLAGCTGPSTLNNEGAGQFVTGNASDNAGNTAEATVMDINIDLTAPDMAGQLPDPTGIDANGAKWYKGDVLVDWVCSDGLSGLDGVCPADSTIGGEGRGLGAGPVSVSDKAGNSSSASVSGVNIDRNGPTISGLATTQPNGAGWYSGLVIVGFSCSDPGLADSSAGSGVMSCPSDIDISDEGANLSVTSGPAKDSAGNSTAGKTVGGINIDNTPPVSSDTVNCTLQNGYCNGGSPVSVTINASDQAALSGVKEIRYSVNGGALQSAAGASANVPVTLSASGTATISYYAVDKAGNAEDAHADSINYDGTAPNVSHTLTPAANAADWSNANTLVHFSAVDDPGGSGVNAATVTPDATYSTETAAEVLTGIAFDLAGNKGTDSFTFKLDKTAPSIAASKAPASPDGNNGWYRQAVKVSFSCSDGLSNVAVCPDPVTLSTNGANQSVTGTAYDKADNTASATAAGINVDMENPTLSIGGVTDDAHYSLGAAPTPTCNASDSYSGVASCGGGVSGGLANGAGTFTYTATATDKAGNSVTKSVKYYVDYAIGSNTAFFLQPINDTGHTVSTTLSVFKAGSTVPVKFQLRNAAGMVVQANSAPVWITPARGNLTTSPVDEAAFQLAGDSGNTFRWDSSAQQYIYNWNTSSTQSGYYWKIGVKLDTGQQIFQDIGLRK
jgi:hypothetical protein